MTWFRSKWGQILVAALAGGVIFAALWLAGFPEVAYLGFVVAATVWGFTRRGRRSISDCLRGGRTETQQG